MDCNDYRTDVSIHNISFLHFFRDSTLLVTNLFPSYQKIINFLDMAFVASDSIPGAVTSSATFHSRNPTIPFVDFLACLCFTSLSFLVSPLNLLCSENFNPINYSALSI